MEGIEDGKNRKSVNDLAIDMNDVWMILQKELADFK